MTADAEGRAEYASPPCFAHELEPAFRGYAPVDRQQARDVACWRKAERARLIALRLATSRKEWPAPIWWPGSNLMHGRLGGHG
jgi:hypothetical protein